MPTDSPLLVFVHTPKAAGSTVIKALDEIGAGLGHIERHRQNERLFLQTAESSAWISGHIPIDEFKQRLEPLDRPIRYFTAMREPHAQVMSHYNWLMEIYFKGDDFYNNHPASVKVISKRLRESNRSKPGVAIRNLRQTPRLFLNYQSRFILGTDFEESGASMDERLNTFEFVSNGTDIDVLLDIMSPGLTSDRRSNVSRYHFDPRLFRHPTVKKFLAENNHLDQALYEHIQQKKAVEQSDAK